MANTLETRQELRPVSSDIVLPTWIETLESRRFLSVSGQSTVESTESISIEIIPPPMQHVMPLAHRQSASLGFGLSSNSDFGYAGMVLVNEFNAALNQWAMMVNAALQNWAMHDLGGMDGMNSGQQSEVHHAPIARETNPSGSQSEYATNNNQNGSQNQTDTDKNNSGTPNHSSGANNSSSNDDSGKSTTPPQQAAGEKVTAPAPQAVTVQSVFSDTRLTTNAKPSVKDAALLDASFENLKDPRERASKPQDSQSSLLNDLRNDKISLTASRRDASNVQRIGRRVTVPVESNAMRSLLHSNRHDNAADQMPGRQFVPMTYDASDLAAMEHEEQGQFTWKQLAALVGTGVLIGSYALAVQRRRKMLMSAWPGIETER